METSYGLVFTYSWDVFWAFLMGVIGATLFKPNKYGYFGSSVLAFIPLAGFDTFLHFSGADPSQFIRISLSIILPLAAIYIFGRKPRER